MKRWSWLSFVVGFAGALVVLGGIWIGISVDAANKAAAHDRFVQCMGDLGFYQDSPPTTDDELDEEAAAGAICHDRAGG